MGLFGKSQREKELDLLEELWARASQVDVSRAADFVQTICSVLDPPLAAPFSRFFTELLAQEKIPDKPYFPDLDFIQQAKIKDELRAWGLHQNRHEHLEKLFEFILSELHLRSPKTLAPSAFNIPLIYALDHPHDMITIIHQKLMEDEYFIREILKTFREQLYYNLMVASDIDPKILAKDNRKKVQHAAFSKLSLPELNDTYLRSTPMHALMNAPIPLRMTHEERYGHMHIIGGTGAGKSTLIKHLMVHDIAAEDCSIVLIDPHSDTIRAFARSALTIDERLIIIDPRDTEFPAALNVFAMNQERMTNYDGVAREQVTASALKTFNYLFSGLADLKLTGKQQTFFDYCMVLLLSFPQTMGRPATILDLLALMKETRKDDPFPFPAALEALGPVQREFFAVDFNSKTFAQTREQLRYRLLSLISTPTMERLFTSPGTKLDFFTELNKGSVILIDTAKDFLKDGSPAFGKLMVSLILQAVLERSAIPAHQRKPTFIFIDECAQVFDDNIDDLLTEVRKYNCGIVLAHQYLDQASGPLRASLHANTAIKFASGVSSSDASAMAREMRTTPEFIQNQPKLQFAAHIRNVTPTAVSIPISPYFEMDRDEVDPYWFDEFQRTNRERISFARAVVENEPEDDPPDPADIYAAKPSKEAWRDAVLYNNQGERIKPLDDEPDIAPEW